MKHYDVVNAGWEGPTLPVRVVPVFGRTGSMPPETMVGALSGVFGVRRVTGPWLTKGQTTIDHATYVAHVVIEGHEAHVRDLVVTLERFGQPVTVEPSCDDHEDCRGSPTLAAACAEGFIAEFKRLTDANNRLSVENQRLKAENQGLGREGLAWREAAMNERARIAHLLIADLTRLGVLRKGIGDKYHLSRERALEIDLGKIPPPTIAPVTQQEEKY